MLQKLKLPIAGMVAGLLLTPPSLTQAAEIGGVMPIHRLLDGIKCEVATFQVDHADDPSDLSARFVLSGAKITLDLKIGRFENSDSSFSYGVPYLDDAVDISGDFASQLAKTIIDERRIVFQMDTNVASKEICRTAKITADGRYGGNYSLLSSLVDTKNSIDKATAGGPVVAASQFVVTQRFQLKQRSEDNDSFSFVFISFGDDSSTARDSAQMIKVEFALNELNDLRGVGLGGDMQRVFSQSADSALFPGLAEDERDLPNKRYIFLRNPNGLLKNTKWVAVPVCAVNGTCQPKAQRAGQRGVFKEYGKVYVMPANEANSLLSTKNVRMLPPNLAAQVNKNGVIGPLKQDTKFLKNLQKLQQVQPNFKLQLQ